MKTATDSKSSRSYGKDALAVRRTRPYHSKFSKSDTASDLFDAAFGDKKTDSRPLSSSTGTFTTSSRIKTPSDVFVDESASKKEPSATKRKQTHSDTKSQGSKTRSGDPAEVEDHPEDPYSFPELPIGGPDDGSRNDASFGWHEDTKKVVGLDVEPQIRNKTKKHQSFVPSTGFEPEDSSDEDDEKSTEDEDEVNTFSQNSTDSQKSLTGNLNDYCKLASPTKATGVKPNKISPKRPHSTTKEDSNDNGESQPKLHRTNSKPRTKPVSSSALDFVEEEEEMEALQKIEGYKGIVKTTSIKAVYKHRWQSSSGEDSQEDETEIIEKSSSLAVTGTSLSQPPPPRGAKVHLSGREDRIIEQKAPSCAGRGFQPSGNTMVVCSRETKTLYTVVRNVKEAHQCHDHGEAQEYADDLEFILDSLKTAATNHLKCLSMMNLAKKCVAAPFRQFIRSRGCTTKIFATVLSDCHNASLALCSSCVLYLLARDRLSVVIDKQTLQLLIQLMEFDVVKKEDRKQYIKSKDQIWDILDKWRKEVQASSADTESFMFDVTEENLSPSFLTTEALVYISAAVVARKTELWFAQEIRQLGGLEIIVRKVVSCVKSLPDSRKELREKDVEVFRMLKRLLRIVENVTFLNPQNQAFLITHKGCALLHACGKIMSFFQEAVVVNEFYTDRANSGSPTGRKTTRRVSPKSAAVAAKVLQNPDCSTNTEVGKLLVSGFSDLIRVLCNLSNDNELCCTKLGQLPDFLKNCMSMVTCLIPKYIPKHNQFDLMLLDLGLIINIVEHCNVNRRWFLSNQAQFYSVEEGKTESLPLLIALTKMFLRHEAIAKAMDEEVDNDLDNAGKRHAEKTATASPEKAREPTTQELQEIMEHVMNKGSKHMEDTMTASYISLFIGCLVQQNEDEADSVKELLPGKTFKCMLENLNKFLDFMDIAHKAGNTKSIKKVIEILEKADNI